MEKLDSINNSRMARIAFDVTKSFIDKNRSKLLSSLLSETRVGALDPQIYAKYLGGISALDDLESSLKREILKGEKTEQEILSEQLRNV